MSRAFELSARAERSFEEIRVFSTERFGPGQTRRYLTLLLDRCQALSDGHLAHRSCREYFADDLRENLRFVTAGSHFVVFIDRGASVVVVDFIHRSADVGNRLGGILP